MACSRRFSALGAFFVATVLLTACGGGIPGDAVVTVGDKTIKKDTYEHWLKIAAISAQGQADPTSGDGPPKVQIPEPPKFTACIADKKKSAPKPAKGQPKQTDAQFKTQCKTEYEGLHDQTLQFLISSQWIASEAADQGVKVSEKDVIKQFKMTKEQSFPKEADFQKFLKSSGMTINDLLLRVRLDTTSNKLRDKIIKDKKNPTSADIKAYYNKNKLRFSQPERRDLRLVLTKTRAQAKRVLAMLKGGAQFSKVAKKFSIDQASKNQGGVLTGASKGQQEKALDDAVFKAKKGKLTGPVKTQFGYYVFKVQKITKASRQSLKDATPTIKQLLSSQGEQTALNDFVKDFQKKWKDMTDCRSGYVTQDCKNAPKQDTTSTGAPGSDGQGAPPQGAPPQGAPPQGGGGAQQAPPQTVPVTPPSGGGSGSGSGSGSGGK